MVCWLLWFNFFFLLLLQWHAPWWTVAVSMIRRQNARSLDFLQAEWMLMLAYSASASRQPGGTWAPSRSFLVKWWSKRRANDSMVILFGINSCHVPEEVESSPLHKRRNWRAAGSLSDSGIVTCLVYGIRGLDGVTISKSLHHNPCFRTMHQQWKDTALYMLPDLCVNLNTSLPYVL